jgi:hypothetical protein
MSMRPFRLRLDAECSSAFRTELETNRTRFLSWSPGSGPSPIAGPPARPAAARSGLSHRSRSTPIVSSDARVSSLPNMSQCEEADASFWRRAVPSRPRLPRIGSPSAATARDAQCRQGRADARDLQRRDCASFGRRVGETRRWRRAGLLAACPEAPALSALGVCVSACIVASSSSAARSESLGSDAPGVVAGRDELACDRLDEAAGAADVDEREFIGRP